MTDKPHNPQAASAFPERQNWNRESYRPQRAYQAEVTDEADEEYNDDHADHNQEDDPYVVLRWSQ